MPVATLVRRAREEGILDFGLTDHIHTPFNIPDLVASRRDYLAANPSPRFHFGVELSVVSKWELGELATGRYANPVYGLRSGGPAWAEPALGLTAENFKELGIEYAVGGTHWPLYVPMDRDSVIRDYHRQNMFLAAHPLVDIVAHPWWWMGKWQDADGRYTTDPWFDDFGKVPASMHDEFAAAAKEHGAVVEINLTAMLLNPGYPDRFKEQYVEYIAGLYGKGVTLSLGSDCHDADYAIDFAKAAAMLERAGIRDDKLWRLPPRSILHTNPA